MKKILAIAILSVMMVGKAAAQESSSSKWSLDTRAWSTNYFASMLYSGITSIVKHYAFDGNTADSLIVERIVPTFDLVFPVGMGKQGLDIYGPYHYAFGNPFKHIGDYAFGVDASFKASTVGFYAGAYFKSQEIRFKHSLGNLRGYYFQPRAGIIIGGKSEAFEAGVFYDAVTGCSGSCTNNPDKDCLKGGWGLDFAFSSKYSNGKGACILQFSMPLHNFLDTKYPGNAGLKRKVGYIMLTQRVYL